MAEPRVNRQSVAPAEREISHSKEQYVQQERDEEEILRSPEVSWNFVEISQKFRTIVSLLSRQKDKALVVDGLSTETIIIHF